MPHCTFHSMFFSFVMTKCWPKLQVYHKGGRRKGMPSGRKVRRPRLRDLHARHAPGSGVSCGFGRTAEQAGAPAHPARWTDVIKLAIATSRCTCQAGRLPIIELNSCGDVKEAKELGSLPGVMARKIWYKLGGAGIPGEVRRCAAQHPEVRCAKAAHWQLLCAPP